MDTEQVLEKMINDAKELREKSGVKSIIIGIHGTDDKMGIICDKTSDNDLFDLVGLMVRELILNLNKKGDLEESETTDLLFLKLLRIKLIANREKTPLTVDKAIQITMAAELIKEIDNMNKSGVENETIN